MSGHCLLFSVDASLKSSVNTEISVLGGIHYLNCLQRKIPLCLIVMLCITTSILKSSAICNFFCIKV